MFSSKDIHCGHMCKTHNLGNMRACNATALLNSQWDNYQSCECQKMPFVWQISNPYCDTRQTMNLTCCTRTQMTTFTLLLSPFWARLQLQSQETLWHLRLRHHSSEKRQHTCWVCANNLSDYFIHVVWCNDRFSLGVNFPVVKWFLSQIFNVLLLCEVICCWDI